MQTMSRRRHHHKPPSNRTTTIRLRHTGTAAEEEPMMIQSHRNEDRRMPPVVHLQPNVIARLMGIDDNDAVVPTPPPPKPVASAVQFQVQRRHTNKRSLLLPHYYSCRGGNDDGVEYSGPSSRLCLNTMVTMRVPGSGWRPRPRRQLRRHPQEEELLQKMRQDLQAWQASKAPQTSSSCTRPSAADSDGGGGTSLVLQAIAQEDLRKQKMARYGLDLGLGHSKVTQQDEITLIKSKKKKKNGSVAQGECDPSSEAEHDHENANAAAELAAMPDDSVVVVSPSTSSPRVAETAAAAAPTAHAQELPSHRLTPIVLLKPTICSDTATTGAAIGDRQKTFFLGLPKLQRDASMSVLLQEVRDRVQRELTLTALASTGRGELIKTPAASAWVIPPLQQVTKRDRCNKRLFRSESFRAVRRDRKRNAGIPPAAATTTTTTRHASPEEEARILKVETAVSPENAGEEESLTDASLSVLRPGVVRVPDGQSFRSEYLTTKHRDDDGAPSPRLIRSLSAPESGFSFSLGRLFSFKQPEASDSEPAAVRKTSKSVVSAGFSSFIRGTVSSLRRHGFSSRRNLLMFRRKTHWSSNNNKTALGAGEIHPARMEMPICAATTPLSHETFNLFKVAQASLSELPPSPVSPLEVAAGHNSRHFLTDVHFTLPPELSPKCLSEFEPPATASESSFRTDITAVETACSRDKAYITELLIAAGLYNDDDDDGPSSLANARVDSMARPMPICDDVFEDVEDMYYYYRGDYIIGGGMYDGTDHRMMFDLANEAVQSLVVESSRGGSSLRQWVVDSTGVSRGKKLVDDVWHKVQALRNNPQAKEMQTIDGMVAYEVRRSVWAEVLYEDVYVVGRKIERAIFDELIEDFFACGKTELADTDELFF